MAVAQKRKSRYAKAKFSYLKKRKVYIISAVRTPIVPVGGTLKHIPVHEMAAEVLNESLSRINLSKSAVDAVFVSNAMGGGGNIARLCTLTAGFPNHILGTSVDRQCVGGLDAINQAVKQIQQGEANLILAGGAESFSLRPERHYPNKWNEKPTLLERPPFFPADDPTLPLGDAIKSLKKEYCISNKEEFEWVQNSHQKAIAANKSFAKEIHAINGTNRIDPFARELSWETFKKSEERFGHTHPCNTAPKADGAAFVAIASEEIVKKYTPSRCVEIIDGFTLGGDPEKFPILPAEAMKKLLVRNTLSWDNISHIELMEAYATQAILCTKLSNAPHAKINPHGGAISRGHPIGASGAVLATHLFHSLANKSLGMAAIAGAGGLASVLLVKSTQLSH